MIDDKAVLIIIDVQKGFDDPRNGPRNNPEMEMNIEKILAHWRETHRPVIHVQHNSLSEKSPLSPNKPGNELKDIVKPLEGEPLFGKTVNSAFIGTNLEAYLRKNGYDKLVMVGLQTDLCVSTTARMAGNLGFETYIVADAVATFDSADHLGHVYEAQLLHDASLASLHEEFATVITMADTVA